MGLRTTNIAYKRSPEITTDGMLPKTWRRLNDNRLYLYKRGSSGFPGTGKEHVLGVDYCDFLCIIMIMEKTFSVGKAASIIGVHVKTLQRWEREGRLVPKRTSTNRRIYAESQIREFQMIKHFENRNSAQVVAYCRVSSNAQKPDLVNQRRIMEEFVVAKGLHNVRFIEEIGGGLNFKRKYFLSLMEDIANRKVKILILAHKDRLIRFGYEWFEHYGKINGCEFMVLNQERLSPEQEMVQDLMTIVHCFSSRLYGLRNYRKKLNEALQLEVQK